MEVKETALTNEANVQSKPVVPVLKTDAPLETNSTKSPSRISVRNLDFFYGIRQVLFGNNLEIAENYVTAIIGPSGCGKSTHIRVYNRIYSLYRDQRAEGEVLLDGKNILADDVDIT